MLAGLIQCWSLALIIASWSISNFEIPFPGPKPNTTSDLVIDDFRCSGFSFPETEVILNDTTFAINTHSEQMSMRCIGNWGEEKDGKMTWLGQIWMDLNVAGSMHGNLTRNDSSNACLATAYNLSECDFTVTIPNMDCNCSGSWDCLVDKCKSEVGLIKGLWQDLLSPMLCPLLGGLIGGSLIDRTPLNMTALPLPRPEAPPLSDNAFIRMGTKIVNVLPSLDGVQLALNLVGLNAASFGVDIEKHFNIHNSSVLPHLIPGIFVKELQLPKGIKLDLDIVIQYFVCIMKTGACQISGLGVYNPRIAGFNDEDLGLDQLLATVFTLLDDFILKPTAGNQTDHNNTMNLTLIPGKELHGPPMFVYGLIGIVPAFIFLSLSLLSIRYHFRRKHTVEKQEEIRRSMVVTQDLADNVRVVLSYSVFRGVFRDVVILFLCNSALMMFVYANATTAVTVSLAGEINIFAFSLRNSVQDFWKSGLKALAFFIAFFSGAYPYFKLIVIVFASVIHRNTKSKVLRIIDSLGRYSFLDSFVMMVLVTTLQVPNIAIVDAHPPFYSFILATVVSMIAGNIACHTYDPGLIVTVIDAEGECVKFETSRPKFIPDEIEETNNNSEKKYKKFSPPLIEEDQDETTKININASTKRSANGYTNNNSLSVTSQSDHGSSSPPLTVPRQKSTNYGSTENVTPVDCASIETPPTTTEDNNIESDIKVQRHNRNNNNNNNRPPFPSKPLSQHIKSPSSGENSDDLYNNNIRSSLLSDGALLKKYGKDGDHSSDLAASPTTPNLMRNFVDFPVLEKPWCHKSTIYFALIFCAICVWAPLFYSGFAGTLRYEFSGFVTFLKGTHQDYSLKRLFMDSPPALGLVAAITVVIIPLFITVYPHEKVLSFLGPWCSTDVFLLTCLAALLQLHDFIKDQAGPLLGGFINCTAELRTPFYVLMVSVVFQQYYIIRAAIGKDPITHRSSDGSPADNDKPPWLLASLVDMA